MKIYIKTSKTQDTFYHFMMGEFLPILYIILSNNIKEVYLYNPNRVWNKALDRFYKDIENETLKINFTNTLDDNPNIYIIQKWDTIIENDQINKIVLVIDYLKNRVKEYYNNNINHDYSTIIQLRKCNNNLRIYYRRFLGRKLYGRRLRYYKDMDLIPNILLKYNIKSKLCYNDGEHLFKQIQPYINIDRLILCHGAGMVFILFMKNNSKITEIIPPDKFKCPHPSTHGILQLKKIKNLEINRIILPNKSSIKQIDEKKFI